MAKQFVSIVATILAFSFGAPTGGFAADRVHEPTEAVVPKHGPLANIRDEIGRMVDRSEIPGMAIAVARDDEILWLEGIGFADVENDRRITADTILPIASVSKSIATTMLMALVSDGTISLDSEVAPLLSPLALDTSSFNESRPIVIRDVLTMTAGIGHGWFGAESYDVIPSNAELLKWYGQTAFSPGENAHYSNWSAGLATLLVEQISGVSIEEFARQRIFRPLGMDNSFSRIPTARINDVAVGYSTSMSPQRIDETGFSVPEGGVGMFSSAHDLMRFGMYHAGTLQPEMQILSGSALAAIHEAPVLGPSYAMGFHNLGGPLISNGNTNRSTAELQIFPEDGLVISILLNRASWDMLPGQIAGKIAEAIRGEPTHSTMTAEIYLSEWEPPYDTSATPLEGRWSGFVIDPRNQEKVSVELTFEKEYASFRFGKADAQLENIRFNPRGQLMASATIDDFILFRDGEDPVAGLTFELLRTEQDQLVGYIRMDRAEDDYFYALPVAACFEQIRS